MAPNDDRASARRQAARAAAYARWAQHDPKPAMARVRDAHLAKLANELDPDHLLPDHERLRRAEALRRSRLAAASAKALRLRAERRAIATEGS